MDFEKKGGRAKQNLSGGLDYGVAKESPRFRGNQLGVLTAWVLKIGMNTVK